MYTLTPIRVLCTNFVVSANSKSVRFTTPATQRIQGQRLHLSDCEGQFWESPRQCLLFLDFWTHHVLNSSAYLPFLPGTSPAAPSSPLRKRASIVATAEDCTSSSKKSTLRASCTLLNHFKSTLMSIAEMYADLPNNPGGNVFGQCQNNLEKRKYIFRHGFAMDPWVKGVVPQPPHAPTTDLITTHFTQIPDHDLHRYFFATPLLVLTYHLVTQFCNGHLFCFSRIRQPSLF